MEESDLPNTGGEGCMRPPGPSTGGGGGGPCAVPVWKGKSRAAKSVFQREVRNLSMLAILCTCDSA